MVKKFEDIFIRFDTTHERDRHTDTAWRHRPRLCIASRGKNDREVIYLYVYAIWYRAIASVSTPYANGVSLKIQRHQHAAVAELAINE